MRGVADPGGTDFLQWEGLDDGQRKLERLTALLLDLRPFWPVVSKLAVEWIGRQFDSQGSFLLGHRWAPLSTEYAAWKTVNYPGKGILSAEGDLRRAATNPRRIATATTLTLRIEEFTKPARRGRLAARRIAPAWFQEGTPQMPPRPLVWDLPAPAEQALERAGDAYVEDMLRRIGL